MLAHPIVPTCVDFLRGCWILNSYGPEVYLAVRSRGPTSSPKKVKTLRYISLLSCFCRFLGCIGWDSIFEMHIGFLCLPHMFEDSPQILNTTSNNLVPKSQGKRTPLNTSEHEANKGLRTKSNPIIPPTISSFLQNSRNFSSSIIYKRARQATSIKPLLLWTF